MLPDTSLEHLSQVMAQATAPAFLLGALAAFMSVLVSRMNRVIDRLRWINAVAETDAGRAHLRDDVPLLKRRIRLLELSIRFAIASAIATTLLISLGFISAFVGIRHERGAGVLFIIALLLFAASLFYLGREASITLSDKDEFG